MKPSLRSMVSMRDRSLGLGARSASTCPGANMPAAKTRLGIIRLIVDMGILLRIWRDLKRRPAGPVPNITICALLAATISAEDAGAERRLQYGDQTRALGA